MEAPPPLEEVPRNIEYVRCAVCQGTRTLAHTPCVGCAGWGYVVDPFDFAERVQLGLKALMPAIIDITPPHRRLTLPSRKRKP